MQLKTTHCVSAVSVKHTLRTADCGLRTADCGLRTGDKMKTESKIQQATGLFTESCYRFHHCELSVNRLTESSVRFTLSDIEANSLEWLQSHSRPHSPFLITYPVEPWHENRRALHSILVPRLRRLRDEKRAMGMRMLQSINVSSVQTSTPSELNSPVYG